MKIKKHLTAKQIAKVKEIYSDKSCVYCSWCRPAVNWWCYNKDAIQYRHTNIPNVIHCPWWAPEKPYIRKEIKNINQ